MLLGTVEGHATATVKHGSLRGVKLVLVQPVRSMTVEPVLAVDRIGAAPGDLVMISSDGKGTREFVGDETSPARFSVLGIVDRAKDVLKA